MPKEVVEGAAAGAEEEAVLVGVALRAPVEQAAPRREQASVRRALRGMLPA